MLQELISGFSTQIHSPATLFTAFILGFLGLVTSCCNVPVFTAVIGYSGAVANGGRKNSLLIAALFFLLGVVLTMILTGLIFSLFGKFVIAGIGHYWKLVAGLLFVFFGLGTMQLIPFRITLFRRNTQYNAQGIWSSVLFGIMLASSSTVCNAICNPVFSLTLGTAFLQNSLSWGTLILLMFGLGFGLPLALGIAGLSFGLNRISSKLQTIAYWIKYGGGVLLLLLGFYFLLTF